MGAELWEQRTRPVLPACLSKSRGDTSECQKAADGMCWHRVPSEKCANLLQTMENNLTRARSISHARSPSTASNTSPTQRFSKGNNWAISAAKLRQTGFTGSAANGGHSRVFSETSLPSRPTFGAGSQDSERLRSSSAMGSKEVDSDTQPNIRGFETRGTRYLEPLHEDDCAPSQADESALRESPPYGESSSSRLSNVDSLASKARSTVQLRDLREQMADLHNKIHSLKHRTREDSLHRRSVQRLKSPNPFTDADIYGSSGSSTPRAGTSADRLQVEPPSSNGRASRESTIIDDASQATSPDPANKMTPMTDNGSETFSKEENRDEHRIPLSEVVLPKPSFMRESKFDPDSPHSQRAELVSADGSNNVLEDEKESPDSDPSVANQDSTSERDLSESPHTSISETDDVQHATPAAPQVISNEDRPDAFDYETFVLNSTMGSFSRQGVRSSTSSASSTSTIGPGEHDEYQHRSFLDAHSQVSLSSSPPRASSSRHRLHQRQDSTDSVSTVATFATATSGDEPSLGNGTSSSYRTASRSASRGALHQSHSSSYLANNSLGFRTPSVASTRLASTIHRPSSSFPAGLSHSNGLNINGLNMHGAKTTRPKQNSTSPTNETSVATRNLILDALFSDAEREGHGATSGPMLAIGPADEALVRSVIDSLQLVCRRLASGEETTEEPVIRMRLEAAATILRSGSGDSG
jgi:hypothetical protein